MVLERHGSRSVQPSRLYWEEISAVGGVWQHDQPLRQRGSLPFILPVPQLFPAKLRYWERDPGLHSQGTQPCYIPTTKKGFSGALSAKFQPTITFVTKFQSHAVWRGLGSGRKALSCCCCCSWPIREFQVTSPRAKVKGCQVPVLSEQVLVDCALRKNAKCCANESSRLGSKGEEGCLSQRELMGKRKRWMLGNPQGRAMLKVGTVQSRAT